MTTNERLAAGIADVALLTVPALGAASWIVLPQLRAVGVVSAITRSGVDSLTNYVQFALVAAILATAFFMGYRRGTSLVASLARALTGDATVSRPARLALSALAAAAAAAFVVNASISSVTHPFIDDFHEGEYLGFIPHLRAGGTLAGAMTTHGPGVDFIPGMATIAFAGPDNGIAVARLAYALLRVVAAVAAFAAVALLCRLLAPAASRARWLETTMVAALVLHAVLRVGGWPDESPMHKPVNVRDSVYLVQVALALGFALAMSAKPAAARAGFAIALLLGVTLPWGPLYSYDRGLYGWAFVLLVTLAALATPWRAMWSAGIALGAAAGAALVFATVPTTDLAAAVAQMRHWMRHGRDMWSYAGLASASDPWIPVLVGGAAAALGCAVLRIVKSIRESGFGVLAREPAVVVMLAASLPPLRTAIERSDDSHIAWGVTAAWILGAALVANVVLPRLLGNGRGDDGGSSESTAVAGIVVSVLAALASPLMNPVAAARRIDVQYLKGHRTADASLLPADRLRARAALGDAIRASPCFVTLTNENTWYYVFDRPPCTPFLQITNARSDAAQRQAIEAIEAKRPEWILVANRSWSNAVDGVTFFNESPRIAEHVLANYEPGRLVDDNWFWRRAGSPRAWTDERVGAVERSPAIAKRVRDAEIIGTLAPAVAATRPDALLLTVGAPPRPLWTGLPDRDGWRAGRWSVTIPTAALAPGDHRLQAWARLGEPTRWVRLGDEVRVQIQ